MSVMVSAQPHKNGKHRDFTIIGDSPRIKTLKETIARVAPTDVSVLITGERGTGKEHVARTLHAMSEREVFVPLNCSAIPEGLVEDALFGHVKGSFTGALTTRPGKFQLANDGTIFLDEIGDMPITTQPKVLRVLELGEFEQVGGLESLYAHARVICATNKDLLEEIRTGRFRKDLYDRLETVKIEVPPLREHLEDVPLLVAAFLESFNKRNGGNVLIDPGAINLVIKIAERIHGNVRGLRSLIENAAIFSDDNSITPDNSTIKAYLQRIELQRFEVPHTELNMPIGTLFHVLKTRSSNELRQPDTVEGRQGFLTELALRLDANLEDLQLFLIANNFTVSDLIKQRTICLINNLLAFKTPRKIIAREIGVNPAHLRSVFAALGINAE
ncbi:MAG: sigma 54-interacting transcriptional regulator [Candidatus Micrarchaeota archaeon]|nr:sigma 54-interacting transcriptional regulator [Candidatus Micrarchaeota archaeon]